MRSSVPRTRPYSAAPPLWQLAPTKDKDGHSVADFMLMIPRMSKRGDLFAKQTAEKISSVCEGFEQQVIFADLNVRLGIIWVSVQAKPGLCAEVAHAIQKSIPEALMVGDQLARAPKALSLFSRIIQGVSKQLNLGKSHHPGLQRL